MLGASRSSSLRCCYPRPCNAPGQTEGFLCHASSDKARVRELDDRLASDGYDPWLDEKKLIPGTKWQLEIPKAVKDAHVILVCVSQNSIGREGYLQREIRLALDAAEEKLDETIFIIPARLEKCRVPDRLSEWQWVDLFEDHGYERLMAALDIRAEDVGALRSRRFCGKGASFWGRQDRGSPGVPPNSSRVPSAEPDSGEADEPEPPAQGPVDPGHDLVDTGPLALEQALEEEKGVEPDRPSAKSWKFSAVVILTIATASWLIYHFGQRTAQAGLHF